MPGGGSDHVAPHGLPGIKQECCGGIPSNFLAIPEPRKPPAAIRSPAQHGTPPQDSAPERRDREQVTAHESTGADTLVEGNRNGAGGGGAEAIDIGVRLVVAKSDLLLDQQAYAQ